MAIKTYTEQLEEVQTAITAIMTGAQSYGIAGRQVTRANLKDLREWERQLRNDVARETSGGIRIQTGMPNR